ncbi:MAG: hypothetical protein Q7P63_15520 [Verrucomicrobiota bacterium JB022]|nr:hypothetical protein [Verrucomicrobiota bacterium JB022]
MRLDFTTDTGSFWVNPDISANTAPSEPVGTFSLLSDFEADRVTVWFSNYIDDGEVFIDYTGSKVDEIRFGTDWSSVIVLGEGGGGDETWGGFDIDDDNNVDTGEWMKWLYVEQAPWIWSYKFKKWLYIEEGNIADNGTWAYIPGDTSPETPGTGTTWSGFSVDANNNADTGEWMGWVQVASTPWIWSYDLGQWIYIEEGFIGSDGAWGFISR